MAFSSPLAADPGNELFLSAEQKEEEPEGTRGALQVFLRKRPLSEKEQQVRAEYDALTVIPRKPYCNEGVLHNCQFQADLKTAFITHIHYGFDCVFPEDVSNEVVYAQTAQPLVQIAMNGGMATMFMFGQTGHGLVQRALFSFFSFRCHLFGEIAGKSLQLIGQRTRSDK